MQIHQLTSPVGSRKRRKIVGRGPGSGHGKTSCRGQGRNQRARAGRGILRVLEGGQMPLIRRLPKVGFRRKSRLLYQVVDLNALSRIKDGTVVDADLLKRKKLIHNRYKPFKILGDGDIKHALTVHAYSFSRGAADKIVKAGGKVHVITAQDVKKETQAQK